MRPRKLFRPQTVESIGIGLIIASIVTGIISLTLWLFFDFWLGLFVGAGVFGLCIDVLFFPSPERIK